MPCRAGSLPSAAGPFAAQALPNPPSQRHSHEPSPSIKSTLSAAVWRSNKGMKLTKLVAAPERQAEVSPRAFRRFAAARTASQLIPGVRPTNGGEWRTSAMCVSVAGPNPSRERLVRQARQSVSGSAPNRPLPFRPATARSGWARPTPTRWLDWLGEMTLARAARLAHASPGIGSAAEQSAVRPERRTACWQSC